MPRRTVSPPAVDSSFIYFHLAGRQYFDSNGRMLFVGVDAVFTAYLFGMLSQDICWGTIMTYCSRGCSTCLLLSFEFTSPTFFFYISRLSFFFGSRAVEYKSCRIDSVDAHDLLFPFRTGTAMFSNCYLSTSFRYRSLTSGRISHLMRRAWRDFPFPFQDCFLCRSLFRYREDFYSIRSGLSLRSEWVD